MSHSYPRRCFFFNFGVDFTTSSIFWCNVRSNGSIQSLHGVAGGWGEQGLPAVPGGTERH